jgi:transcriptional regulator with XRE-family HTH domain
MPRSPTSARTGRHGTDDVDRHVGARIRERRLVLGLTQHRLAELIGTTYQQVQRYERSLDRLSAGRLLVTARALGVEPGHFFEGLGAERPAEPTPRQQAVLGLAQSFFALPRRQQEALCELARALAGAETDAAPGPEETDEAA